MLVCLADREHVPFIEAQVERTAAVAGGAEADPLPGDAGNASHPFEVLHGPSAAHWFGTDQLGRDVLARVITGSRDILIITPLATLLGTVCGTTRWSGGSDGIMIAPARDTTADVIMPSP